MSSHIHIIASCTDRKRRGKAVPLRLGDIPKGSRRLESWWTALSSDPSPKLTATDLYVGDLWSVTCDLPLVAQHAWQVAYLWVASAGYGLVPADAVLVPYSATFRRGVADSVHVGAAAEAAGALQSWWEGLAKHPGPVAGAPRRIMHLAERSPRSTILVVASPMYLTAMANDLVETRAALSSPDRLVIVSSGLTPDAAILEENLVQSVAELQHLVAGGRTSLHARVARKLLEALPPEHLNAPTAQAMCADWVRACPSLKQYDREKQRDVQVLQFIRSRLTQEPSLSHSRLLRELRASGRACEQGRFRELYLSVKPTS
ncbi:hypothetical protein [Hyalangium rubrum]|uniref:Uncharacterized protein n=1 Tax=Hyalangium rubrum TaxID=3103134 RepID=A0ABU5HDI7_9BACT|nr:hypothetical protein [Hyalangium sp. s54d21]MDY7231533.1 hypothetical protein [Hyalangium sp. s54d21]